MTPSPPSGAHQARTLQAQAQAQKLRAFNRFYTRRIGVLGDSPKGAERAGGPAPARFSLTESRVLWELAHSPGMAATTLAQDLGLDRGYISRLLARLQQQGLVRAPRSADDARQKPLSLTPVGLRAFATLDRRAQAQALALLAPLPALQQQELLYAASRMQQLMSPHSAAEVPTLRALQAGELGWVVSRHGALYSAEYGWDQRFEALVARVAADYVDLLDATRERAWVAELRGQAMGCVYLVQARQENSGKALPGVAQLRLLLVEPAARGHGLGKQLVQQCHQFAAQAGYKKVRLWTNSLLLAARGIYQSAGYRLLSSEAHHSFGHALVGEVWELDLPRTPPP